MLTNKPRRKRDSRSPRVLYTPGFNMAEMEFRDDKAAIAEELAAFDHRAKEKAAALGKIIAEDFERERKQLLAECLRKRGEDLIEIKLLEMQEAIEADRDDARKVFAAYAERVATQFRNAIENEGKWREETKAALNRIQGDINRSTVRAERLKLLERGVLRGRR